MTDDGRGVNRTRVLGVALLGVVVVAAAVGVALAATTPPSGESILNDTADQYRSAESLTGVADVTVSNATTNHTATVEYAAAPPDGLRLKLTSDGRSLTMGTNGSVAWVSAPAAGIERTWNVERAEDSTRSGDEPTPERWSESRVAATCAAVQNRTLTAAADRNGGNDRNATMAGVAAVSAIDCDEVAAEWADAERAVPTNRSAWMDHSNWTNHTNRTNATPNLTATRTGGTTVNGTDAYVVSIEPENGSSAVNASAVVAKNDSRLLETRLVDGENATVVRYHDQRFNVSMADDTFAPPSVGSDRATYDDRGALRNAVDDALPRLDASGYAFEQGIVTRTRGTTVAQRYANATTTATLVSTDADGVPYDALNGTSVEVDGRNATVSEIRGQSVVVWTSGESTYAVTTDGSADEAVALARTVSMPS